MMKDHEKIEDLLIDEFYSELPEDQLTDIQFQNEYGSFKEKLENSKIKLDMLNADVLDFTIDTMSIIEQVDKIREGKKSKKEFILFTLVSTVILSLYVALGFVLGPKVIIASQLAILTLIPWVIIPSAISKRKGSEV